MRCLRFLTLAAVLVLPLLAGVDTAHAFGRKQAIEGQSLTGDSCRTRMLARLGFSDAAPVSLQQTFTGVDLGEIAPCELELSMTESTGRTSYLNVYFKSHPEMWPYGAVPISRLYPVDSAQKQEWTCVENETAIQVTYEFEEDREGGASHRRMLTLDRQGADLLATFTDDNHHFACRLR